MSSWEIRHGRPIACKSVRPTGERRAALSSRADKKKSFLSASARTEFATHMCNKRYLNNLKRASVTFDVQRLMQMKQEMGPKRQAPLYSSHQLFSSSFFLMNWMNSSCSLRDSPWFAAWNQTSFPPTYRMRVCVCVSGFSTEREPRDCELSPMILKCAGQHLAKWTSEASEHEHPGYRSYLYRNFADSEQKWVVCAIID